MSDIWLYGSRSQGKLATCHHELVDVFNLYRERQFFEITIIWGWRSPEQQMDAFLSNASTKDGINDLSEHQAIDDTGQPCSNAVDFGPWIRALVYLGRILTRLPSSVAFYLRAMIN